MDAVTIGAGFILPALTLCVTFAKLIARQSIPSMPRDTETLCSPKRYCPMEHLLTEADQKFVASHLHSAQHMRSNFPRVRLRIFRGYMQQRSSDFHGICNPLNDDSVPSVNAYKVEVRLSSPKQIGVDRIKFGELLPFIDETRSYLNGIECSPDRLVKRGTGQSAEIREMVRVLVLSALFCCPATAAPTPGSPPSSPVPATLFGMHIHDPVSTSWPNVPIGALGKGTQTFWIYVEPNAPVSGVHSYDWSRLDSYVQFARAHSIDYVASNGYIPKWAAADLTTCTYTPVSQPTGNACTGMVDASHIADWQAFCQALVKHYTSVGVQTGCTISNFQCHGVLPYYELWNEPDVLTEYSGGVAGMVQLTQILHDAVRLYDPNAKILSPSNSGYDVVDANGLPTFMDAYWSSGGTKDVDIISLHAYPPGNNDSAETLNKSLFTQVQALLKKYGLSSKPLWDTEGSWGNAGIQMGFNDTLKAAFVARDYLLHWSNGILRLNWYGWDFSDYGTLYKAGQTQTYTPAAQAYQQTYNWMVGATMTGPCTYNTSDAYNAVYTCTLTRPDGYQAQVVWNTQGSANYTVPSPFTQYRDLAGTTLPVPSARTVTIGQQPILLETPLSSAACDVNKDGMTNVLDVQAEVNQALGVAACTSDINKDGLCNVIDVQRVVNTALGGACVSP
jgi:hypothetical protein